MAGTEPRGDAKLRGFARQIAKLQRDLRTLEVAAQGAYRSVEEGSVDFYDEDGVLRERVGKQKDGSYGRVTLDGPVPPIPSEPDVVVIDNGVVAITWDGRTEEKWPISEFRMVRVHLGDTATFTPTRNNQVGAIHAQRGGTIVAVTESDDDNPAYVRLVAVSKAGHTSSPSDAVLVDELDEDGYDEEDEEIEWEADDFHTITAANIAAGTTTFPLSHDPEVESLLAWWHPGGAGYAGVPQAPDAFTVNYDTQSVTWPLTGVEEAGDRLRVHYAYRGPAADITIVGTSSAAVTGVTGAGKPATLEVPVPGGIAADDLLLLCAGRTDGQTVTAGWALEESITDPMIGGLFLYSKVADGTEASVTITGGETDWHAGIVVALRGVTSLTVGSRAEIPTSDLTFDSPAATGTRRIAFAQFDGPNDGVNENIVSVAGGTLLANLTTTDNVGNLIWGLAAADGDATFTGSTLVGDTRWRGITAGVS